MGEVLDNLLTNAVEEFVIPMPKRLVGASFLNTRVYCGVGRDQRYG